MTALETAIAAVSIYAESHPRPPHVTQAQACDMLRLSAPTVRRLIRSGALRLNSAGMIPVAEVDRLIEARAA